MLQTYKIKKSAEFIFEYLTDMRKFASVHPVISKIESLGQNKFLVYETLKLGFIPFSFAYPVSIESNKEQKKIVMHATVMKINKIEMIYDIKEDKGVSVVNEQINFKSILPIKFIMERIFKKQHAEFFENVRNL
jgi:carbon monoxide dehydrogenase subunit G